MNRKTAMILLLAVGSGLGAMMASTKMLSGSQGGPVEMQEVLVASRDLEIEELLKPDNVKLVTIPKANVPAGSFAGVAEVEGRWVQIKTLEGEPIVDKKLAAKGVPTGLVARIPPGKRAFALNVNEQSGVSGFILPDHHVDVIQVKTISSPGGDQAVAESVLEDVLVLASGTTIQSPVDRSILSKTVTVAVTPEEASILTAAQSRGTLSLALRGINDRGLTIRPPVVAAIPPTPAPEPKPEPKPEPVVVAPPPPPPAPEPAPAPKRIASRDEPPRHVTIYRGGRGAERVSLTGANPPPIPESGTGPESEVARGFGQPAGFPSGSALFRLPGLLPIGGGSPPSDPGTGD